MLRGKIFVMVKYHGRMGRGIVITDLKEQII
jgi:hypothetical protein